MVSTSPTRYPETVEPRKAPVRWRTAAFPVSLVLTGIVTVGLVGVPGEPPSVPGKEKTGGVKPHTHKAPPSPLRVGIRLGGKPPQGEREIDRARKVAERILRIAYEDYRRTYGSAPTGLRDLLSGNPPVLKALPEDPAIPGRPYRPDWLPEISSKSR